MDLSTARFLTSDEGRALLDAVRETRDLPPHRRVKAHLGSGSGTQVRAALHQDDLRRRALRRIPMAQRLLFTQEALEQATAWQVAESRAVSCEGIEGTITDLGAGVGIDALAFATRGREVIAYERDPVRALLLRHNVAAIDARRRIDVREEDVLAARPSGDLAYLDPGRRPGGVRTWDPDRFEPPRAAWPELLDRFRTSVRKLPPGDPEVEGFEAFEVVSLDRRVRETRVFRGELPDRRPPCAIWCLPAWLWMAGPPISWPPARAPREGDLLLDPDPAATVAGMVGNVCRHTGSVPVHPRIACLVGAKIPRVTAGVWIRIEAVLRPRAREVKAWLEARDAGALTIRTRGTADSAETWRKRLGRWKGPDPVTLVFTRGPDDAWICLAGHEVEADPSADRPA